MTVFKAVYAATMLILWLCIILNSLCILRSNKLHKYYDVAIEAARAAEKNFLEAAETYRTMCKELKEDRAE